MKPDKKLYVFDLDGTLYLGDTVLPDATETVNALRAQNKRVVFFTNNSTRSCKTYLSRLAGMGFCPTEDEVMTSAAVTEDFLLRCRPGKSVYLVGTRDLCAEFERVGIPLSDDAEIVVSAFDNELSYEKARTACLLVSHGAEYFSTHPDPSCPDRGGLVPDSGAIAAMITAVTGVTPRFFGKPFPDVPQYISRVTGISPDDTVFIGDRMNTDVAVGKKNGIASVLITSDELSRRQLAAAKPEEMPDFIFDTVGGILTI